MKKILLSVTVVATLLLSCIDDKESVSVEALRKAQTVKINAEVAKLGAETKVEEALALTNAALAN